MTARERILTALAGDTPDRVPIWAWGVHPWLGEVHESLQPVVDAYLDGGDLVHWWSPGAGTFLTASDEVSATSETGPSALPDYDAHTSTYSTPGGELSEVQYVSRHGRPGYRKEYLLESEEDIEKLLSIPYVPPQPDCSGFAALDEEMGERGTLMISMPADPMYFVNNLIGSERFAIWSIEERDLIDGLIREFGRRIHEWVEWVISQDVGSVFGYVGPELCIPPLQSPSDFDEWVVDLDRGINDLIRDAGGHVVVHCHGRMGSVLEGFVRMNASALHPIEPPPMGDVTMVEAKERVGDDLCIIGNIQEHDIWTLPTPQFRKLVEQTMREGMEGGGFILSPTATPFGWPTMSELARDNWLAMLEVGLETGQY